MDDSLEFIFHSNLFYDEENKCYINSKILEDLIGKKIPNKRRFIENYIEPIISDTPLHLSDVIKVFGAEIDGKRQHGNPGGTIFVAYRIMQVLIVSVKLPWTDLRKAYLARFISPALNISHGSIFFKESENYTEVETQTDSYNCRHEFTVVGERPGARQDVVDSSTQTTEHKPPSQSLVDACCQTSQMRISHKSQRLSTNKWVTTKLKEKIIGNKNQARMSCSWGSDTPGASRRFWDDIVNYADKRQFGIEELIFKFLEEANLRKAKNSKRSSVVNHIKGICNALFGTEDMTRREKFREELTVSSTTGNWQQILQVVRRHLQITGLGKNIVPSIRTLSRKKHDLLGYFMQTMKPEQTQSGFRIDLVNAVQLFVYSMMGRTDLTNIEVDIWGDGAQVGRDDVTRLAFRILNKEVGISCQSVQSVVTFAAFSGKIFTHM